MADCLCPANERFVEDSEEEEEDYFEVEEAEAAKIEVLLESIKSNIESMTKRISTLETLASAPPHADIRYRKRMTLKRKKEAIMIEKIKNKLYLPS